jgi:hypothetical protein
VDLATLPLISPTKVRRAVTENAEKMVRDVTVNLIGTALWSIYRAKKNKQVQEFEVINN